MRRKSFMWFEGGHLCTLMDPLEPNFPEPWICLWTYIGNKVMPYYLRDARPEDGNLSLTNQEMLDLKDLWGRTNLPREMYEVTYLNDDLILSFHYEPGSSILVSSVHVFHYRKSAHCLMKYAYT